MPRSRQFTDEERKQRKRAANARYAASNCEAVRASRARWRSENHETIKAKSRAYYASNKARIKPVARDQHLRRTYGITAAECLDMLKLQGGVCAVCRADKLTAEWHVDHCHSTGKVRGVLCHHCNLMLGHARDNPATLGAAINYLIDHTFTDEGLNGDQEITHERCGRTDPPHGKSAEGHVGEQTLA